MVAMCRRAASLCPAPVASRAPGRWTSSTGNHREGKGRATPRLSLKSSPNKDKKKYCVASEEMRCWVFFPLKLSEAAKRAIKRRHVYCCPCPCAAPGDDATFQRCGYLYLARGAPDIARPGSTAFSLNPLLERTFLVCSSNLMHGSRCISGNSTLKTAVSTFIKSESL